MFSILKSLLAIVWQFVVYYFKGDGSKDQLLKQRDEELAAERARVAALEAAAAKERSERLRIVREKAAAVRNAGDAASLLRGVTGADDTDTN